MNAPVLYIPLAIEWTILITAFMPRLLVGMFYKTPRFGLTLWFTYFTSTVIASIIAITVAIWALAEYVELIWGPSSVELEMFNHLGLWALVAISGIVIALLNLKTEPLVAQAKIARKELALASRNLIEFQGVPVREIVFPVPLAFVAKVGGKTSILVSSSAIGELTPAELEAMYWHELGHIRGRHNQVQAFAKIVALLTPILSASKLFAAETEHLTEIIADNYAKIHVGEVLLSSARAKFLE